MIAQYLGMTHIHYTDEFISSGLKLSYTGPVIKAA